MSPGSVCVPGLKVFFGRPFQRNSLRETPKRKHRPGDGEQIDSLSRALIMGAADAM
jgi:hypothetical protein